MWSRPDGVGRSGTLARDMALCAVMSSAMLLCVTTTGCEREASDATPTTTLEAPSKTTKGAAQAATGLDRSNAQIPIPDNLPRLDPTPVVWSVARRAKMLHDDGRKALKGGQLKEALSALAGSVQLDPSRSSAHVDLARVYARAGRSSVALGILETLSKDLSACGGCIEGLHAATLSPEFATVWATERGKKVQSAVAKLTLPWETWAERASGSLKDGTGKLLTGFVHAKIPFMLARSCPTCSNPERRQPQLRQLAGGRIAIKLASRFNTASERLGGVPLTTKGKAKRSGRCMQWQLPKPVPVGTAALQQLCFRPITAERAALTRVDIVYGRSNADVARTPK